MMIFKSHVALTLIKVANCWGSGTRAGPRPSGGDGGAGLTIPRLCDEQPFLGTPTAQRLKVFGPRVGSFARDLGGVGPASLLAGRAPLRWRGRRLATWAPAVSPPIRAKIKNYAQNH